MLEPTASFTDWVSWPTFISTTATKSAFWVHSRTSSDGNGQIVLSSNRPIDSPRLRRCLTTLSAERADEVPAVFTKIHLHFVVKGRGLDPKKVERAINLSVEKYCSATAMLEKTANVTHDYEVIETA